jgi:predicted ribosome quality control (RQC) complex YloA/Tae2 family protein
VNEKLIEQIVSELADALIQTAFREAIQLTDDRFILSFDGEEFRLLNIDLNPIGPAIYLIERKWRELKKNKMNTAKFVADLQKWFHGSNVSRIEKLENERVLQISFENSDDRSLIVQLTGKSANLFILDVDRTILAAAKRPGAEEQTIGKVYFPPQTIVQKQTNDAIDLTTFRSISETLDEYFSAREKAEDHTKVAAAARRKASAEISKSKRLIRNLESDLRQHGDADRWKRYGDLLLANQATAVRENDLVKVADLFQDDAPTIEIEVDANDTLAEAAQKYFRKFSKAQKAAIETNQRIEIATEQLKRAESTLTHVEDAIARDDIPFLEKFTGGQTKPVTEKKKAASRLPPGIRSFLSSDDFEILVGKKAVDNDVLTFKVANSRDTWMHAADYPGSHVVIRNPNKTEIPQRTLLQAAQLAAFYSQGKKQTKAAVHYTEKKFVNKPKGAAPGLVRLASFKTLLVVPEFPTSVQAAEQKSAKR